MAKKNITLDDLSLMVKHGFDDVHQGMNARFNAVDKRFDAVDHEIKELKQGQENIELKLSNVAYRFELEEVKQRVMVLEKKLNVKSVK